MPDIMDAYQVDLALRSELVGRIGCFAGGRTYVVPVAYAYDGQSVFGWSRDGSKLRVMRSNPEVCFEIDHVERLDTWHSVIAWGTFEELRGDGALRAARLLRQRVGTPKPSAASLAGRLLRDGAAIALGGESAHPDLHVFRIRLWEKTGRIERP